jgi:iron(III) transport system permease protein
MAGRTAVRAGAALVAAGLLAALAGAPLVELARIAAERGWRAAFDALGSAQNLGALRNTLIVGCAVTAVAVACGAAAALAVERRPLRERRLLRLAVAAPLLTPEFVLGFSWSRAYGPAGFTDRYLHVQLPGLLGPTGIIVALSAHALPLAYLVVAASLATRPVGQLERAAHASGAGTLTVLRTITLPLLRTPLLAAAALVFVTCVNSFAIPEVLGTPAGFSTMSTLVYDDLNLSADPDAFRQLAAVALTMAALVLVVIGAADVVLGGPQTAEAAGRVTSTPSAVARRSRTATWTPRVLVTAFALFAAAIPLVVLAADAITRAPGLSPAPSHWTLANFSAAMAGETVPALARSLALAAAAAVLIPAMSLAVVATGPRVRGPLGTAVTLAYAIPGSALAVGVLIAYGRWFVGSALIILIAYAGKLWALGHRPVAAAAARLDPALTRAARASGAGPLTAWRAATLPGLAPALAAGGALVLIFASHELTMSSILYGPGTQTLAVVVLNQQQLGQTGPTSALALVLGIPPLLAGLALAHGHRTAAAADAMPRRPTTAAIPVTAGTA